MPFEFPDPRVYAPAATPPGDGAGARRAAIAAAQASLARTSARDSEADDGTLDAAIDVALADTSGEALTALFAAAPDAAVYRHLWRRLDARVATPVVTAPALGVALFALPLVIVTAHREGGDAQLDGRLRDPAAVAALLREHGVLAANRTLALAPGLVPASALALECLPALRAMAGEAMAGGAPVDIAPMHLDVTPQERAHLRFIVGTALVAPGVDVLRSPPAPGLARALARQLMDEGAVSATGVQALVLPRPPASLPRALAEGLASQREVSAQLFLSNALRSLRSRFGEPTAILSAHRLGDGSGELRVSLSSPFSPRDAEGFRCPLLPFERVADAVAMLEALLVDCRVTDARAEPGIHDDREPATGLPLLFKPEPAAPLAH